MASAEASGTPCRKCGGRTITKSAGRYCERCGPQDDRRQPVTDKDEGEGSLTFDFS